MLCLKLCWGTYGHCIFKGFVDVKGRHLNHQWSLQSLRFFGVFWFKNIQNASSTLYMFFLANLTRSGSLHQPKQKQRGRPESTGRVACFADLQMPMIQRDDTRRLITVEQNITVCVLCKNKYVHEYHPISQANVGAPVWGAALRARWKGIWCSSRMPGV